MTLLKIVAVLVIVAGVLALVYGEFDYTKEKHQTNLGPVEVSVDDNETVKVPVWAGVVAIAAGGVMLLLGSRKSQ